MPGPDFDPEVMDRYDRIPLLTDIGVYTKKETLDHKIEMVRRLLKSLAAEGTEAYNDAINDEGETYSGVYWTVRFNFETMSLEETLEFKNGIESYDSVSMPMSIGYHGELKRIWFASSKQWLGYFDVEMVRGNDVYIEAWHPLEHSEDYPRKPFQGFTYKVPAMDARQYKCTVDGVCNYQRQWHYPCCANPVDCEHKKKTNFDPTAEKDFEVVEEDN